MKYNRIKSYYLNKKGITLAILLSGLFFDGLMSFIPSLLGNVISLVDQEKSFKEIAIACLILFVSVLFIQMNRFFKRYFVRLFANNTTLLMRSKMIENVLYSNLSQISDKADLMNKNLSDISDTVEGMRKTTTEVFDSFVILVSYFIMMMCYDWMITLISTVFIVVSIAIASLVKKAIYQLTKEFKKEQTLLKEQALDRIENNRYYQGLGITSSMNEKYNEVIESYGKKKERALFLGNSLEPIYYIIAMVGIIFILYFGSKKVIDGAWKVGMFTAYLEMFALASTKASKVGKAFNSFFKAKVSWKRVKPLLGEMEVIPSFEKKSDELILKDVSFKVNSFSLSKINLCFHENETIGIKGKVHSGKSLFSLLLTGLLDYQGTITYFGNELRDLKNSDIGMCYLGNPAAVFDLSVKDNILLGRKGDIKKASTLAKFEEVVEKMINGYDTLLSHSYVNLSGGEKARLQIARGIASNQMVTIYDDQFSSIDNAMALSIIENIKRRENGLVFIISNNPSILNEMDRVIDMEVYSCENN